MKKLTLLLGILLAFNILTSNAQERGRMQEKAEVRIEEYKERLNLTEDQLADIKKMREKLKPQFKEIHDDESMTRSDKMRARADLIEQQEAEIEKILDDEQIAELAEIRKEVKEQGKKRRTRRRARKANDGNN